MLVTGPMGRQEGKAGLGRNVNKHQRAWSCDRAIEPHAGIIRFDNDANDTRIRPLLTGRKDAAPLRPCLSLRPSKHTKSLSLETKGAKALDARTRLQCPGGPDGHATELAPITETFILSPRTEGPLIESRRQINNAETGPPADAPSLRRVTPSYLDCDERLFALARSLKSTAGIGTYLDS